MTRPPLTAAQGRVFDFICDFNSAYGYSPTMVEIAEALGFKSSNASLCHTKNIEKKGYIRIGANKARSIAIISHQNMNGHSTSMEGEMGRAIEKLGLLSKHEQAACIALIDFYSNKARSAAR